MKEHILPRQLHVINYTITITITLKKALNKHYFYAFFISPCILVSLENLNHPVERNLYLKAYIFTTLHVIKYTEKMQTL